MNFYVLYRIGLDDEGNEYKNPIATFSESKIAEAEKDYLNMLPEMFSGQFSGTYFKVIEENVL